MCPYITVTLAPILLACSAIAFPILPELKFVITRIGSICSIVLPIVTKMFLSDNEDILLMLDSLNLSNTDFRTCSGWASLAFPSMITGSKNSTPRSFNLYIFSLINGFSYIDLCIAGAIIIGILDPRATLKTEVTGVSSIPLLIFPNVLAVHG